MKTLMSSFSLGALVVLSLVECYNAQGAYAGVASGAASGAGTGSFAGFPSFPFPSPPLAPLPYFNQGFPFFQPFPFFDFNAYNLQLQNWIKASELQAQQAAANGKKPFGPLFGSAAAQGMFGPQGGFGQTFIYPPPKDGQSLTFKSFMPPPPGVNQFGVSSFSSSSFSDVNGDKKGTQFATVTVNDNGNITTVVSSDPQNDIAAVAPQDIGNGPA
ncbi:hypothetical protein M8J75_002636 [Diaphorina citri]|nr:hypothetical protein M8J75_002636 [Diaphorina citri]KAI5756620.1 hypothetical protein M8J77_026432 [Diaphorina citri]